MITCYTRAMDNSSRGGIVTRIVWLFVASAITILIVRLVYDIAVASPQGQLAATIYSWSTALLAPVAWLYTQVALPATLPSGFNIQVPIAIGLYVLFGWLITTLLGLFRRGI